MSEYQLFHCYGIHYTWDDHDKLLSVIGEIPLDRSIGKSEKKPRIVRGVDDPDNPNHAFIYAHDTEDSGTYLDIPSSVLNFNTASLIRTELRYRAVIVEINKIYDKMILVVNPNCLHLGWSAYIARVPIKQDNCELLGDISDTIKNELTLS